MPVEVLRLQALAGNRAVSARYAAAPAPAQGAVSGAGPVVQRDVAPGRVDDAVQDLYGLLVGYRGSSERVLRAILMQKDHRSELAPKYREKFSRSLDDDLRALPADDAVRARCYLEFGTLRPADKIFLAVHGKLTDQTAVRRIAPEIARDRAANEREFADSYGAQYPADATLPDGSSSRIGGALMAEMLAATFAERFRTAAVLAYGAPRAADDVKIATVQATSDAGLLFDALQREDATKICKDFEASYHEPLKQYLARETSLHTKARALMLIDGTVAPADRLIETVRIATAGYTTADADFIFDAVSHADDAQLAAFRKAMEAKDPRLRSIDDTFGGMNAEQRDRFNALVGVGDNTGILGDPLVRRLRAEGGNGGDGVFDVLKNSTGAAYTAYREAYGDTRSPLNRYVSQFAGNSQKGWLASYVFADLPARLDYAMANPGMDDYLVFLVTSFADAGTRRGLATDAAFGAKLARQPTATRNKVLLVLEPGGLTPQERAVWLDAAVARESGSGVGALTGSAETLGDENRELQVAKERFTAGGRKPTPEEEAELDRLAGRTQDALTAFVAYRDELEAAVSTAVDMAVGLLVGVATGGVGGIEMILLAAARAAAANALARVVSQKLVRGDRFDVVGADGAAAFVTGAVDGMLNVVGPAVGKGLRAAPELAEAAADAARTAAPNAFRGFASGTGARMAEGAAVGGLSSAVDAAAHDQTWSDGFDRGMRRMLTQAAAGAATGAAVNAVPPALGALMAGAGTVQAFEAVIDALPDAASALEKVTLRPADAAGAAPAPSVQPVVQRADNYGKEFESFVDTRLWTTGLPPDVPPMTWVVPGAHNHLDNGIDRIGVVITGDSIDVYHFEMKWRNPALPGQSPPKVKLNKPSLGTQAGPAWTTGAVESLCESGHPSAVATRDSLRAMLAQARGTAPGAVSELEVKAFLRAHINPTRVVVVPSHVDTRRLWKQLAGLMRWGVDARLVKVPVP